MNVRQIVSSATTDETVDLLKACIDELPEDALLDALSEKLTIAQIDELQARLP